MTSDEIKSCLNSVKKEVLNNFSDSMKDTITEKLKEYSNEDNRISSSELAMFAYTEALITAVNLSTEITTKTLIEMFATD